MTDAPADPDPASPNPASPDPSAIPILEHPIRAVSGRLADEGALQRATLDLLSAGFDRAELELPVRGETPASGQDARQARTLVNSTASVVGALVGGTIASVATGGAILPVIAAAIVAGAGAGTIAHVGFQEAVVAREAAHDEQGQAGALVLSVMVRDAEKEALAMRVLKDAGATGISLSRREALPPPGSSKPA